MPSTSRLAEWWAGAWRWVLFAAGAIIATYFLLEAGQRSGIVTASVLAVLVIGAAATGSHALAIPLLAMPALFVVQRVGLGPTDLSVSDAALAAAFGVAVLLGQRPYSGPMRQLLWFNLAYQFVTLFTVIVNPYVANTVEWFHAWLLISGALIVGWAIGASGRARTALSLMLGAACIIALGTIVTAILNFAQGDFTGVYPRWPLPMHKNAAGTLMGFMAITAYVNPGWLGWAKGWRWLSFWLLVVGVLLTQSRQALIGLVVAALVIAVRGEMRRRSIFIILMAIPALILVASTVIEQIDSQNQHNSFFQRLDWLREVYALWKHSPWFGHGLRYWTDHPYSNFQPPQAELEVLASTGVLGLAAFIVMWIGILVVLWRIDPRFGTLAFAVVFSRIAQAQFDLFWVAAQVSVPFVIAGLCLGAMAHAESQRGEPGVRAVARDSSLRPQEAGVGRVVA
ncbi:O-antigen ligase family protein [Microbacterium lacus]|uniref:O-antigen ligase family protein n=1 Tax=Microbacterium lacus TaxID=415217 RepID=UPI0038502719